MKDSALRGLPLVAAEDALRGDAPAFIERYVRKLTLGSANHMGWLAFLSAITPRGFRATLPPSVREQLEKSSSELREYTTRKTSLQSLKKSRSLAFHLAPIAEKKAVASVLAAQERLTTQSSTLLDQHAMRVVERYAGLAAYHSVAAVCHSLDAAENPEAGLKALAEVSAARAYQAVGLGSARHLAFRRKALEQAEWELSRYQTQFSKEQLLPLSGQIFHEYLGNHWKTHQEIEALSLSEFAHWALGPGLKDERSRSQ